MLDIRNTHEKIFWTHQIPTRNYSEPTKYLREKLSDPRNTHQKDFGLTKARLQGGKRPTRPTMARDLRNLARSIRSFTNP